MEPQTERRIHIGFSDKPKSQYLDVIDRFQEPTIIVHINGCTDRIYYDPTKGVAHLDFSFALASYRSHIEHKETPQDGDETVWEDFCKKLAEIIDNLLVSTKLRMEKAATSSRERIVNIPEQNKGNLFEIDVFNLLRSIFPYAEKWGGKDRTDGFVSLHYFKKNNTQQEEKYLWSYDPKYSSSDKQYNFDRGEHRKVLDYIVTLSEQRELTVRGNRYRSHVIISNNLDIARIQDCAEFLLKQSSFKELESFTLVFMDIGFLTTFFDLVKKNQDEISRRGTLIFEFMAKHLSTKSKGKDISILDRGVAESIVSEIMQSTPLDTRPDFALVTP